MKLYYLISYHIILHYIILCIHVYLYTQVVPDGAANFSIAARSLDPTHRNLCFRCSYYYAGLHIPCLSHNAHRTREAQPEVPYAPAGLGA